MGFDGFYFARIDYEDKYTRVVSKMMEMVWRGSPSLGESTEMFTGVLYHHYIPPAGFCFDQSCTDQPIQVQGAMYSYEHSHFTACILVM